jgi:uncharacterized protein YjhX (UPF0386 family)
MEINRVFGFFLEKLLISQFHTIVWKCWGNRIHGIIPNCLHKKEYTFIGSKLDFMFKLKNKQAINIRKGINTLRLRNSKIKGGWHMITVKFFESKLFMKF